MISIGIDPGLTGLLECFATVTSNTCWASVSPVIRPLVLRLPQELVEVLDMPGGWLNAKLFHEGEELFYGLKWV